MQVSVGAETICFNLCETARQRADGLVQMDTALRLMELEAQATRSVLPEMAALRRDHAAWLFKFEDIEPETADSEQVLELVASAPNSFAKGLIFGMFSLRMQIAAVTGRGF